MWEKFSALYLWPGGKEGKRRRGGSNIYQKGVKGKKRGEQSISGQEGERGRGGIKRGRVVMYEPCSNA